MLRLASLLRGGQASDAAQWYAILAVISAAVF